MELSKENIELIAEVCHNTNKVYCDSIGDISQVEWDEAPEWQKHSAIKGVEAHLENPETTPQQTHENWYKHKEAEGWKFGINKDETLKTHPCMIPYFQLPREQRIKDYLFKQCIKNCLTIFERMNLIK